MGCCFSSEDDKTSQQGDPDERSRLLGNPVGNTTRPTHRPEAYETHTPLPFGPRGDEQSALNKILHQTASNVIDVSAMDSHLEQHEYLDRARQYTQRVNGFGQKLSYVPRRVCLLADLPAPEKILSADPVSPADLQLMEESFVKVLQALEDVKVVHKEDLVVQFGIP